MPRLNGVELARKLRAKHERLLVLLISGSDVADIDPDDDIELLPKPYNEAALATKVRELLRRRVSDNSARTQS